MNLESALANVEIEKTELRLEIEKVRDESNLLRGVVLANLARIADPIPNKMLTVTAYTVTELKEFPDQELLTASLNKPREGHVAVSRDLFNNGWVFGKKVYIKNHGVFVITDLMGNSKTRSVDIFMNDYGRALQFGKRQIEVVLLDV
ncbi:3D domain-containing protein [Fundidesulfovibrio magnetotacticus]|uniref:3D domain-containing protein n=1 Tax=Fundidesulfovibrio magnetotacticus TaxID=2730080 RepID=UPI0015631680|nr:3D domain-containing protein [Fundidesulfovibrio magnetotacticus]